LAVEEDAEIMRGESLRNVADLKAAKSQLRGTVRGKLREAGQEALEKWSDQITARILDLPEYPAAETIMVYLSLRNEYRSGPLIEAALSAGKNVCAPKVVWQTWQMYAVALDGPNDFEEDERGLKEPRSDKQIAADQIDLVLVPGLAFDLRGRRLGRGGGFYDRFLARSDLHARKVAAAFDLQIVSRLPFDSHDQPVDLIVTTTKLLRFVHRQC